MVLRTRSRKNRLYSDGYGLNGNRDPLELVAVRLLDQLDDLTGATNAFQAFRG